MSLLTGMVATMRRVISPITSSGNFIGSGAAPGPVVSATRTLTVPAGNPGQIKFTSVFQSATNFTYSLNGGANTAITEGLVVNVANGNSLTTRISGGVAFDGGSATIIDPNAAGTPTVATVVHTFSS